MVLLWEWIKKSSASLFRKKKIGWKKIQISRFMNTELKSDLGSDSDSDVELMTKLKSGSDSE